MNDREPLEPDMESEDQEAELDPIRDLNNTLNQRGRILDREQRTDPTLNWDENAGYSLSSGRSPAKHSGAAYFAPERVETPPTRKGSRFSVRHFISKLFVRRK